MIKVPKKLIEVALPLDDINEAAAHEKQPGIGAHPRGLHLWWARRPLAVARAVIFAQMVNDPGYERQLGRGMNKKDAALERERLFQIIRDLVRWENSGNKDLLNKARAEIERSWREACELNKNHPRASELFKPESLPAFHDPFAGGGALPLEAQRLGLEAHASDLNPVAVTINKAMIEIPPKFSGSKPVGPVPSEELIAAWSGVAGLAEDVRRYGAWIKEKAAQRLGGLYPKVKITSSMVTERPDLKLLLGQELHVLTWLWARTVKSPNPAYSHVHVPLVSTFMLSSKPGKEAYLEPIIKKDQYHFVVRLGKPKNAGLVENGTKLARGANFRCILSDSPLDQEYIRGEFKAKRTGLTLIAIIAEGTRGRVYLPPSAEHESIALGAQPLWRPEIEMNQESKDLLSGRGYGFKYWHELFTARQLLALTTYSELIHEAIKKCEQDALQSGMSNDSQGLEDGGSGAVAYAQSVGIYLAFALSRLADYGSSIATWKPSGEQVMQTFKRQAIPMTWDFPESNFLGDKAICWENAVKYTADNLENTRAMVNVPKGFACQLNAQSQALSKDKVVSTDPPYYDNISYADLSDYFYIWLRSSLKSIFPKLYSTMAVPKAEELIAASYRHGGREQAETFFLDGMTRAIHNVATLAHPAFPVTIYYAFKQSETEDDAGTSSTGWGTFLEAVLSAGFSITGTWPMRTELSNRMIGSGTNALASSIVLVCRQRSSNAATISRREFIRELNAVLPDSLDEMTCGGLHSPVAPVDLSQAIIGPGMAIFSKYAAVLEADGKPMTVHTALQLINRFLSEDEFDHDTQFCLHWFETFGWSAGKFGEADVLARAKGTSVDGVAQAGVLESGGGSVRLLKFSEYPSDWNPEGDQRMPIWETLHHLIRVLRSGGEGEAGKLFARIHKQAEPIRALAYRLYTLCERKGWAEDARAYNDLVTSWPQIEAISHKAGRVQTQMEFSTGEKQ